MGWQLLPDAAGSEPRPSRRTRQTLQRLRHQTFVALIGRTATEIAHPGLTRAAAADTAWAIASPETYDLLVRTIGHDLDAYEKWISTTLVAALLRPIFRVIIQG